MQLLLRLYTNPEFTVIAGLKTALDIEVSGRLKERGCLHVVELIGRIYTNN